MKKQDNQIEIVGVSEHVKYLHQQIDHAANNDHTVLIQWPTGTGKNIVAHNIHF
jgi:transcriptional regulator with GAF, ATPase, and Fis domain